MLLHLILESYKIIKIQLCNVIFYFPGVHISIYNVAIH